MTASTPAKVRLQMTEITFVASEADAERGPNVRALAVGKDIFHRALKWAEGLGWKNPDQSFLVRSLPRAAVPGLVSTLRGALEAEPAAPASRSERMSAKGMSAEYFAVPENRRQLARVLDFLALGGELTVTDA